MPKDSVSSFMTDNSNVSLGGTKSSDNFPWSGVGSYGSGGTPAYYANSQPSKNDFAVMARNTSIGKRCTYIFGDDIYSNEFKFKFTDNTLTELEATETNNEIRQHFIDIMAYSEGRRVCGFDFEQGEAELNVYRKGDGIIFLEKPSDEIRPEYFSFVEPADWNKDILRVEAINYTDYTVNTVSSFGEASQIRMEFYSPSMGNSLPSLRSSVYTTFWVHPSRCIRWKSDNIDYDQYHGASKLGANFDVLQIIAKIIHSTGNAVQRYAWGQPWIKFKGNMSSDAFGKFKQKMGNPLDLQYFFTDATVEDIKMLGVSNSHMDLPSIIQMLGVLVCAGIGIPKPILMGESIGMTRPGEVSDKQYYASLTKEQVKQNTFWRQLIAIDPWMQRKFKEKKILHYEFDWGLKQVLSMTEQADLEMRQISNAVAKMAFCTFAEVRHGLGLPSFAERAKHLTNGEAIYMELYMMTPDMFDEIIPNFGTIRQMLAQEQVSSREEQQGERTQELAENNNPTNAVRSELKEQPGSLEKKHAAATSEARRREMKNIRESPSEGGRDIEYASLAGQNEIYRAMIDEILSLRQKMSVAQLVEQFGGNRNKWTENLAKMEAMKKEWEKADEQPPE